MGTGKNRIAVLSAEFVGAAILFDVYGGLELNLALILKGFLNLGRRTSGESRAAYIKYVSRTNSEVQRPQGLKGEEYAV